MKRIVDVTSAFIGLVLLSPILLITGLAIWLEDRRSPLYMAKRVGRGGRDFRMMKFRSMVVGADRTGVSSTSSTDRRITRVGRYVRALKLDEITQLWNVLTGDMSLVGPRPQVQRDAALYTQTERRMLSVRPGITDLASIVFADEGEILKDSPDPDLLYHQIIRPWKSRLALLSIDHSGIVADLRIILVTALALLSRESALRHVRGMLEDWDAEELLLRVATRQQPLPPYPPPGASEVVAFYLV